MRTLLLTAAAIGLIAACSDPSSTAHDDHDSTGDLTPAQQQAITEVRNVTARFQTLAVAQGDGYNKQYPPGCATSPEGAQAFHWLNEALVDDKVELLKPELLMYEPQADGSMKLIGVDYVVPLSASATPPTLLGVPFMKNEPLGVWALHIWAWRPNPSGMFAAWNPDVSCANAPPQG